MKRLFKGSMAAAFAAVIFMGSMPYTAVSVSADNNEKQYVQSANDAESTGKWGSCNWTYNNGILTISGGVANSSKSWRSYKNSIEKIVITGKITFEKGTSLNSLFSDMTSLKTIEGLGNFDTSEVINMAYMFMQCESLTGIDVSGFDTSNVTDMASMFYGCKKLKSIDVSHFDTSKVKNMSFMFSFCGELKSVDVSNFNTENVTTMEAMFQNMSQCDVLDVKNFDTSKVTDMSYMFSGCRQLKSIDVSNFDTSNVMRMVCMFQFVSQCDVIDVKNFNTSKVTDMTDMFSGCSALKNIDVSGFDTSNVTNMKGMFLDVSQCEVIDVKNFNTSKVTDMASMFSGCSSLKSIDISNFDTSNVTKMVAMFQSVSQCEELDVSNFDTSKVTDMSYMFSGCSSLKNIDVSGFDTSNVTNMRAMFQSTRLYEGFELKNFNTSKVTDMSWMFNDCRLYNLDLNGFDMSKVTQMTYMFMNNRLVTIKTPAKFAEDKDTFIQEMKSGMKSGKWIDETNGVNYEDTVSIGLSEGHSYRFNPEKMNADFYTTDMAEGKRLTVNVNGGASGYKYKFIMYNPKTDKWTLLRDYSLSNTYILNTAGNGERKIYVDVKDALGDVVRAATTITLIGQESLTVEASKNETDKQVTFTAVAAGGSSEYTYKFIVYNKTTGTWGVVQNYSDKNTCTWTKGSAGDRDFYVDVKDSDGNVVRSKAMNVKIESNKPIAVLTPSATALSAGDKLTLTASTNKTGCTYKFLIYNPATNQWFKLQDFSSKNTCTWTAGSKGTRQFYVDVKDASGNVTRSKAVNVTIGGEGTLSVKTTVSANTSKPGDKITFTAVATGGKAGYTYKMVVYNKTTKTWGLVQNFNANNKITWTSGSAGDRDFYIDVKDADGKVVRSSVMNVKTAN